MSEHPSEFDDFVRTIHLDELCEAAARCRDGIPCCLGPHIIGGFNVVYELIFSDEIVWMARIPLPYNCFQPEEVSASYAATLRYLKKFSTIPVPEVFAYNAQSNPENLVNATYILMERLPGHQLPVLERKSFEPDLKDVALAEKVHRQLTSVILQLASLKFDKIGSLQENPEGNFFIGPYIDPSSTAYPKHRAKTYQSLIPEHKGPFSSISSWDNAMAELNRQTALGDPEDEEYRAETVADYEILAEFSDRIVVKEFSHGPFVINHSDLTVQNILVDDEFNITGILDFPGTVVPVPSLCVFPWLFSDNISGLIPDRDAYLKIFLKEECQFPSSALRSSKIRGELMQSAITREQFELGLLGPYTSLVLPKLFKAIHKRPFESDVEYRRIASTRTWFKQLFPSWVNGL
ncbi:hypothetical protein PRK78_006761 [Emydomyces testavorans]|uniref:Aminoglycoside phosphotransferase domain-containing protein n=1 Tax=Emydomyces testavorans TaxID=2070801 RepID=A0AAF0IM10_9EURO|nr:hypothetical protein PRK78_006761 [Emydomyces testavorans]